MLKMTHIDGADIYIILRHINSIGTDEEGNTTIYLTDGATIPVVHELDKVADMIKGLGGLNFYDATTS